MTDATSQANRAMMDRDLASAALTPQNSPPAGFILTARAVRSTPSGSNLHY
jgi:hypothetical protein